MLALSPQSQHFWPVWVVCIVLYKLPEKVASLFHSLSRLSTDGQMHWGVLRVLVVLCPLALENDITASVLSQFL